MDMQNASNFVAKWKIPEKNNQIKEETKDNIPRINNKLGNTVQIL